MLRHQLKKYVGAVQMLRREGGEEGVNASRLSSVAPDLRDFHDEAVAYENKLIQVKKMVNEDKKYTAVFRAIF